MSEPKPNQLQDYDDSEIDPRDAYRAMDLAFAKIWDDPKMSDYDDYEQMKRQT